MPIYTKKGDGGQTSLLDGSRVSKNCCCLQVVGALDELNAGLGIVAVELAERKTGRDVEQLNEAIKKIQRELFVVGAELAGLQIEGGQGVKQQDVKQGKKNKLISKSEISWLEQQIDKMSARLPVLKNFILPGGSKSAAYLQQARAVCRRAERELAALGKECEQKKQARPRPELYKYLNRLSDFLFVSARRVNFELGAKEEKV